MQAITATDSGPRFATDHPAPSQSAGDATCRVLHALITDDDRAAAASSFRGVLGSCFVATVEAGAPNLKPGAKVVVNPAVPCGKCDLCRSGLSLHCGQRSILGIRGRDGGLATTVAVPAANLVPIPDAVDPIHALFAVPVAAAVHAAHITRLEGKAFVTVLGDGLMGLLCAQVMARLNASVRLLGDNPDRFNLCEKWGVKHRHRDEVGRRQDQNVVIETTGSPISLDLAMHLVRPRGKIVMTSPRWQQGPALDLAPIVAAELELIGARTGPTADGLAAIAANRIDLAALITQRITLDQAPAALKRPDLAPIVTI